ncbi:hypothetical protein BH20GEM3_BH20GEM3_07270 [soil metagenome]
MRFLLALPVVLAACAPTTQSIPATPTLDPVMPPFEVVDEPAPVAPPLASPIVVSLASPVAVARERTLTASAAEGLRVERADWDAGRVRSAGVLAVAVAAEGLPPATVQEEYFFHAMVEPADPGSRVVPSVSVRSHRRTAADTVTTPEAEMQECQWLDRADGAAAFQRCEQQMARVQARLDNLARRVHSPGK